MADETRWSTASWKSQISDRPDVLQSMLKTWKLISEQQDRPYVELHASWCPKITSAGKELCRCGGNPLDVLLAR